MSLAMAITMIATGYGQEILINGKVSTITDLAKYKTKNDTITIKKSDSIAKTFEALDLKIDDYGIIFPKEEKRLKSLGRIRPNKLQKVD